MKLDKLCESSILASLQPSWGKNRLHLVISVLAKKTTCLCPSQPVPADQSSFAGSCAVDRCHREKVMLNFHHSPTSSQQPDVLLWEPGSKRTLVAVRKDGRGHCPSPSTTTPPFAPPLFLTWRIETTGDARRAIPLLPPSGLIDTVIFGTFPRPLREIAHERAAK
jgi:hypothetical protein